MPSRTLPNLGLTGFFDLGENGWDDEMSLNLLLLSTLTQAGVVEMVSATPGSPTDGQVYLFDETHPTQANKIAIRDAGAWIYVTPQEGWRVYDRSANVLRLFNGTVWAEFTSGGGGVEEAPEDGLLYGRRDAAWEEITATGGGGSTGALTVIERVELGTAQADVVFSSIPNSYEDLIVVVNGRSTRSGSAFDDLRLQVNGDTGTNYDNQGFESNGVSGTSTATAAVQHINAGWIPGATAPTDASGQSEMVLSSYGETTFQKTLLGRTSLKTADNTSGLWFRDFSGWWRNTAAINALRVFPLASDFAAGTVVTLYGRGGAAGGGAVGSETVSETTTARDLAASDVTKYIRFTNTSAKTLTVRPDATHTLPDDGEWHIRNAASGDLTLVEGSGVTINPPSGGTLVIPTGGTATLKRVAVDEFDLLGQTVPV